MLIITAVLGVGGLLLSVLALISNPFAFALVFIIPGSFIFLVNLWVAYGVTLLLGKWLRIEEPDSPMAGMITVTAAILIDGLLCGIVGATAFCISLKSDSLGMLLSAPYAMFAPRSILSKIPDATGVSGYLIRVLKSVAGSIDFVVRVWIVYGIVAFIRGRKAKKALKQQPAGETPEEVNDNEEN